MKRILPFTAVALAVLVCTGSALAQTIDGSKHDFAGETWNTEGEICVVCHTPHNALVNEFLWNHEATVATFTPYSSSELQASVGQPDAGSKLCLSCHDGTVAVDSYGGNTGTDFITPGDGAFVGTDLSNDHPVSFVYDAALATADGGLHDPTTANSGLGGTIDNDLLRGAKVQCTSCHNPHDDTVGDFLVMPNTNSDLCLACHNK